MTNKDRTLFESGKLYTRIPEQKMKCNVCSKEANQLIPIYEFANVSIGFNYKITFHCKSCFIKSFDDVTLDK